MTVDLSLTPKYWMSISKIIWQNECNVPRQTSLISATLAWALCNERNPCILRFLIFRFILPQHIWEHLYMMVDLSLTPKYWMSILKIIWQNRSNISKTKTFHFHKLCAIRGTFAEWGFHFLRPLSNSKFTISTWECR